MNCLLMRIFILFLAVQCSANAQGHARYLYLENCSDFEIMGIVVETNSQDDRSKAPDWQPSGRKWAQLPLLSREAACFDANDMYGDVPDGAEARLSLKIEDRDPIPCPALTIDKAVDGDLIVQKYLSIASMSDTMLIAEGCHTMTHLDWQPAHERCRGQGERIRNIQCE